ncbi:MAG: FAD-binding oxidoreductase [bacterium]|nr:FAD-binding oxidoreductase [bacterium]
MSQAIKKEVYWYTKKSPVTQPLTENISTDVVVVGGGVAGLTVADRLSREGKHVVLLERDFCGAGASGKSSGMVAQDSELGLAGLIEHCGPEDAKLLWEFVGGGLEIMRRNIKEHGIECDYQEQDYVFMANNRRGFRKVMDEYKSRKLLGYEGRLYDKKTVSNIIGSRKYVGALRYPGTFALNSYLYVQGMREILLKRGVKIFEGTEVTDFDNKGVVVRGGAYRVLAEQIVLCVDRFLPEFKRFKKDVYHIETYLTISKPLKEEDAQRLFPSGNIIVADSDMIYQYYRITGDRRLLLGGGDYLTTYAYTQSKKPEHIIPKLTRYMKKKFPGFNIEVEYVWPGLLGVSKDLVPLMGVDRVLPNVYYITTATGLAWATALGNYIGEKILEGRSDYDEVFSLYRKFPFDPFMRMLQPLTTTPMAFGLSHAFVEYLR